MGKSKTYKSCFRSRLSVAFDIGGKVMTLTRPLVFWDSDGKKHVVPVGAKVNGASFDADKEKLRWFGRVLMFFFGSPVEDFWLYPSALHDYLCDNGQRLGYTSKNVHDIFGDALIVCVYKSAESIKDKKEREKQIKKDLKTTKKFHWAVSKFGPRW